MYNNRLFSLLSIKEVLVIGRGRLWQAWGLGVRTRAGQNPHHHSLKGGKERGGKGCEEVMLETYLS